MISAVVLCLNEERHLTGCLETLTWADEIVVLDSGSIDQSRAIAWRFTDRVFERPFDNFSRQRNAALDLARGDWVLFVDADERVPRDLADEIQAVVTASVDRAGYWVPRRNLILGRWIAHSGWYPDFQLRLLRRERARYDEAQAVHEVARVAGTTGHLTKALVHINYERLDEFVQKQGRYAAFEAETMFAQGIRPRPQNFVLQPLREFHRRYVKQKGYQDGPHGLLLAFLMAYFTFVTYRGLARRWGEGDVVPSPSGGGLGRGPFLATRAPQVPTGSLSPALSGYPLGGEREMNGAVTCSVVIVSYNVADLLERCVASVLASAAVGEVIVVDNASADGSADHIAACHPAVRLIRNQQNVGFPRAVNQGIALATGQVIMVLNPDCEVCPGAIERLCAFLDENPDVAAVGPRLVYGDGRAQSSCRRFPGVADLFIESTVLEQYGIGRTRLSRYRCEDLDAAGAQDVDWLVGACIVAQRSALERVGVLDEGYFMYFEEVDWYRRVRAAGWRVGYLPEAEVVHHYGKSAEQEVALRDIRFNESKLRYARKWHGRAVAEVLRLSLLLGFWWRLGVETVKLMVGHRPALRRSRIRDLRRVLESGLEIG